MKLDYSLKTVEERKEYLDKQILQTKDKWSQQELEQMADYLIFTKEMDNSKILSPNREITIGRRETSYEGLASKLESGEDGIYNMMSSLGKSALSNIPNRDKISEKDIEEVPNLRELRQEIKQLEKRIEKASGRARFLLNKQLIQMRQDQYVLRNEFRQKGIGVVSSFVDMSKEYKHINLDFDDENIIIDKQTGEVKNTDKNAISLFNPLHISYILQFYEKLKIEGGEDSLQLLFEIDNLIKKSLCGNPLLTSILVYKVEGLTNAEIQKKIHKEYDIYFSFEHISDLWRNKIPKILAEEYQKEYLIWYYTYKDKRPENWKVCTRCGQKKLINPKFFSRNSSSRDGFYSICKECRKKINIERKGARDDNGRQK